MDRDTISFIDKYVKEIRENNAAMFIGAGFSIPSGFVDWANLLKPFAEDLGLDISKELDLISLAQYYKNERNSRSDINNTILGEFSKNAEIDENHKIIARLPISTFWTTNYDSLIEDALKNIGKIPDVKYTIKQLLTTKAKRDAVVYKMHGDKEHPGDTIFLKEDYEKYHNDYGPFITALQGDLVSKTFLFVGFSFTDPNLNYVLSRTLIKYDGHGRAHYAFIKSINADAYNNEADFEYDQRKQELFINDLKRYSIQSLMIDDYGDITKILHLIEKKINQDRIFISGSAADYAPWETDKANAFISGLSKSLISRNYGIVSGFGLGVGSLVIAGALEEIYMKQQTINNDQLLLRPFPQVVLDGQDLQELWRRYREDMISNVGVSIFIFGNKIDETGEKTTRANGVYSEFEIACAHGNIIVPVGATGSVAQEIWEIVNSDFEKFYPKPSPDLLGYFRKLNELVDTNELINTITLFIDEARKCISV